MVWISLGMWVDSGLIAEIKPEENSPGVWQGMRQLSNPQVGHHKHPAEPQEQRIPYPVIQEEGGQDEKT